MSHRSRGCLRCRQRRVKCDRNRPSCQRCIARNELCVGYRDESDLMFQDETDKITLKNQSSSSNSSNSPATRRTRSRSLERPISTPRSNTFTHAQPRTLPWLKSTSIDNKNSTEDQAVSSFLDKYVIYPCTSSSTPGFLEHLPCLFQEVNIEGRYALRFAVQAASFAELSKTESSEAMAKRALECYGCALKALGESLAERGKVPDDYDLMTVVILDIFEILFITDSPSLGSHAQGMANILRLRGHSQFHDPRGWSLFRLAHHRIQKQQLAKQLDPLPESRDWLEALNGEMSFVHLEKDSLSISEICQKANRLLTSLDDGQLSYDQLVSLVEEMLQLDEEAAQWRQKPEWAFKTFHKSEIRGDDDSISRLPETVELHPDIWMAYEWNYHRTARIILHQRLLACIRRASSIARLHCHSDPEEKLSERERLSLRITHRLVEGILASAPQSLGDINVLGYCHPANAARFQAVGAYLLLWPIKVIKSPESAANESQKTTARELFERIRMCTGMKSHLGALSNI